MCTASNMIESLAPEGGAENAARAAGGTLAFYLKTHLVDLT
jgi:hypothetical protein